MPINSGHALLSATSTVFHGVVAFLCVCVCGCVRVWVRACVYVLFVSLLVPPWLMRMCACIVCCAAMVSTTLHKLV